MGSLLFGATAQAGGQVQPLAFNPTVHQAAMGVASQSGVLGEEPVHVQTQSQPDPAWRVGFGDGLAEVLVGQLVGHQPSPPVLGVFLGRDSAVQRRQGRSQRGPSLARGVSRDQAHLGVGEGPQRAGQEAQCLASGGKQPRGPFLLARPDHDLQADGASGGDVGVEAGQVPAQGQGQGPGRGKGRPRADQGPPGQGQEPHRQVHHPIRIPQHQGHRRFQVADALDGRGQGADSEPQFHPAGRALHLHGTGVGLPLEENLDTLARRGDELRSVEGEACRPEHALAGPGLGIQLAFTVQVHQRHSHEMRRGT